MVEKVVWAVRVAAGQSVRKVQSPQISTFKFHIEINERGGVLRLTEPRSVMTRRVEGRESRAEGLKQRGEAKVESRETSVEGLRKRRERRAPATKGKRQ